MVKTVSLKEAQTEYSISLNKTDLAQGPLILEHEGKPIASDISVLPESAADAIGLQRDGELEKDLTFELQDP